MITASTIILVAMLLLAAATLWAFCWAAANQQFEDFPEGAQSIFDADEPVGEATDPNLTDSQHPQA